MLLYARSKEAECRKVIFLYLSGDGFYGEIKSVVVEEIYDRIIDLSGKEDVIGILEENGLEIKI